MYWRPPSAAELKAFSWFKASDFPEPVVEVWDDNWAACAFFTDVMTQWRTGPGGPIGLDYGVIYQALERKGYKGVEFDQMMDDIGVMERRALKIIHKN